MTLEVGTLKTEFSNDTNNDTSDSDFDNLLTDFVKIEDPQGLTDSVDHEIGALSTLPETKVEADFKNEVFAYDLYEKYTTSTTNATHTYGDFISNFHDFMKFELHSIPKPTDAGGELLNDYNDLEQRVDVDQSKSDESVIIADAVHEVADLFALGKDSTNTKLLTDYAEWAADILLEAKTQGIDDKGNLVLDWWTPDRYNSWSQAYLNKYKGDSIFWKHEGMELSTGTDEKLGDFVNVNGSVDPKTNDTKADGTGNKVWMKTGRIDDSSNREVYVVNGKLLTEIITDEQKGDTEIVNYIDEEGQQSNRLSDLYYWVVKFINDSGHTEEVRNICGSKNPKGKNPVSLRRKTQRRKTSHQPNYTSYTLRSHRTYTQGRWRW
ncbi:hypothetical protein [Aerosakkonema funiforme]|uniref:hypothetical protein n=1 Tax=Aerosakkonema funiforme TaxID=1246630 RepID=UPI0035B7B985